MAGLRQVRQVQVEVAIIVAVITVAFSVVGMGAEAEVEGSVVEEVMVLVLEHGPSNLV